MIDSHARQSQSHSQSDRPSPPLTDAELIQLQVRTIALESVVIALLAEATPEQLARVRAMASHIAPRAGTVHRLTTHAAAAIETLLERAGSAPR